CERCPSRFAKKYHARCKLEGVLPTQTPNFQAAAHVDTLGFACVFLRISLIVAARENGNVRDSTTTRDDDAQSRAEPGHCRGGAGRLAVVVGISRSRRDSGSDTGRRYPDEAAPGVRCSGRPGAA